MRGARQDHRVTTAAANWTIPIAALIEAGQTVVRATLLGATGSSPRVPGSSLVVTSTTIEGDLGGTLHDAVAASARALLAQSGHGPWHRSVLDHALNPIMEQRNGGVSRVLLEVFGPREARTLARPSGPVALRPLAAGPPLIWAGTDTLPDELPAATAAQLLSGARNIVLYHGKDGEALAELIASPLAQLVVYGSGKVATALTRIVPGLPFVLTWLETATAEEMVATAAHAPDASFHVVTTGNHGTDYRITRTLLQHGRFAYLGMIGAGTKRQRLLDRLAADGLSPESLARIHCPIGLRDIKGKEPAVIAVSIAAQILTVLRPFGS